MDIVEAYSRMGMLGFIGQGALFGLAPSMMVVFFPNEGHPVGLFGIVTIPVAATIAVPSVIIGAVTGAM